MSDKETTSPLVILETKSLIQERLMKNVRLFETMTVRYF